MSDSGMEVHYGWVYCENCGKKLLKRKPNGVFVFKFGRHQDTGKDVVEVEIVGNFRFRCFRSECRHMNEINFFPAGFAPGGE